jgi:hypothetical protein
MSIPRYIQLLNGPLSTRCLKAFSTTPLIFLLLGLGVAKTPFIIFGFFFFFFFFLLIKKTKERKVVSQMSRGGRRGGRIHSNLVLLVFYFLFL